MFPQTLFVEVQGGARTFSFAHYFRDNKRIFCDFSGGMELENEKTESVNKNKNKQMLMRFQNTLCNKSKNTKKREGVECHIRNPLNPSYSKWLDIGLVFSLRFLWTAANWAFIQPSRPRSWSIICVSILGKQMLRGSLYKYTFCTYAKIAAARCPRLIPGKLTSICLSNFCFDIKKHCR